MDAFVSYVNELISTANATLIPKVITLGTWDMDSSGGVNAAHGITDFTKIRTAQVFVKANGGEVYPITHNGAGGLNYSTGLIAASRINAGFFDSASFNNAIAWAVIQYLP